MKRSCVAIVSAVLLVVALALLGGCGKKTTTSDSSGANEEIIGNVTGESITVNKGEEFQVSLDANPSTGYEWKVTQEPDPAVLQSEGSEFIGASTMPGAGGKEVWKYKALAAGGTSITYTNARSWEKDEKPAWTHNVSVKVVDTPDASTAEPKIYKASPIDETVGNEFIISMSEQTASTGYTWLLQPGFDKKVCVFEGVTFITATDTTPGAEQTEVWNFEAVGAGTTTLTFKYVQPFDKTAKAARTLTFTVNVK